MTTEAKAPEGFINEDGEWAWVTVTRETATEEAARAWLAGHAEDVFSFEPEASRLYPERITLRHLQVDWPAAGWQLPDGRSIIDAALDGLKDVYWVFDISDCTEEKPDYDWKRAMAQRQAERNEKRKREAVELRGPWWWRLRCGVADRLLKAGGALEPRDRSSTSWEEEGMLHIAEVRRPRV